MILVGPSLGAAIAIDFAVNHPEAVSKYDSAHQGLAQSVSYPFLQLKRLRLRVKS